MLEDEKSILKNLGNRIKQIRIEKSMTQVEVSSLMNKDQQSLQRVESGRVNPSYCYLLLLSRALNIELKELVDFK